MSKMDSSFLEVTPPTMEKQPLVEEVEFWPEWRRHWARWRVASRVPFPQHFLQAEAAPPTKPEKTSAIILLDGAIAESHVELKDRARLLFTPRQQERMAVIDHATAMASVAVGATTGFAQGCDLWSAPLATAERSLFENYFDQLLELLPDLLKKYQGRCVIAGTLLGERSTFIDNRVEKLIQLGAPVVWAAGNRGGQLKDFSPTNNPELITVGASSFNDAALWEKGLRTHYGPELTLFAPGKYIYSAWESTEKKYNLCSGTSPATMIVASDLAMRLATGESPAKIKAALVADTTCDLLLLPNEIEKTPNRLLYSLRLSKATASPELYA